MMTFHVDMLWPYLDIFYEVGAQFFYKHLVVLRNTMVSLYGHPTILFRFMTNMVAKELWDCISRSRNPVALDH